MVSKLLSIPLSLLIVTLASAQSEFNTLGKYSFRQEFYFGDSLTISPGQLSKNGNNYYFGIHADADTGDVYDIYRFDLKTRLTPLYIAAIPGYIELIQPSVNADGTCIILTVNSFKGWGRNDLMQCIYDESGNVIQSRLLNELNAKDTSDAYPWISPDGKNIYFTRGDKLFFSSRKSIDSDFDPPTPLQFEGDFQLEVISCWLTNNEKKIFIVSDNKIYMSKRSNKKKPFPLPALHTAEFNDMEFISAVSFTPDLKQMYMYHSGERASILHYSSK